MFDKIKKYSLQFLVLMMNIGLVAGGVSYFKNQKKESSPTDDVAQQPTEDNSVTEKAAQLQQLMDNISGVKKEEVSKNTGTVTVQKPKTVTQTVPGGTQTTTSTPTPKPAATTKKS